MNTTTQQTARAEAIAGADAYLNNAGLPAYTELLATLNTVRSLIDGSQPKDLPGARMVIDHVVNRI